MVKLLTNSICEFEVLSKTDLLETDSVNALSAVFFKRDQYYKNFGIYIRGIRRIVDFIDQDWNNPKDNGYVLLLFIDVNVKNDSQIMDIINKSRNTVPVLFKCSEYMKGDFHIDLFGTLVRFFPMFDFPDNPFNVSCCVDIDLHNDDYYRLKNLMDHRPEGFTAAGEASRLIYQNKPAYIYAGLIYYNRKKESHKIIEHFIKTAESIDSKGNYGKRLTTFGYGIDEIFINDIFVPIIKDYTTTIEYQISYFLYHSKDYILDKKRIDKTSELFDMVMGDYAHKNWHVKKKLGFIDKNTYQIRKLTEKNDHLNRRFTHVIDYLIENNKTWFEYPVMQFIHKYLRHVVSTTLLIHCNVKNGIKDVTLIDTVYTSEYTDN